MATIHDVNAALDTLGSSLDSQLTAIQTEIQQLADAGGADPAELQALADRIGSFNTAVQATITQLGADDPTP